MEDELLMINNRANDLFNKYNEINKSYEDLKIKVENELNQNEISLENLQQLKSEIDFAYNSTKNGISNNLLKLANEIDVLIPKINSGSSIMERISRSEGYQAKQQQKTQNINQMNELKNKLRSNEKSLFNIRNNLNLLSEKVSRKMNPKSATDLLSNSSTSNSNSNSKANSLGFSDRQRRVGFGGRSRRHKKSNKKVNKPKKSKRKRGKIYKRK